MPVERIVRFIACLMVVNPVLVASVKAAKTCGEDADYQYAEQLRERGSCIDALVVYQALLERYPTCMAAKLEMGFCHLQLGEYKRGETLLNEVRKATFQDKNNPEDAARVRQLIEAQLAWIPQLRKRSLAQRESIELRKGGASTPYAQFSVAMGASDNINGGVQFDELTFGLGDDTITQALSEESKAQHGNWLDFEAASQRSLKLTGPLSGQAYLMAGWRHSLNAAGSDLGTVRGVVELEPVESSVPNDPRIVLSGGSFVLNGDGYRNDLAVGMRFSPKVMGRKLSFGYQFADHDYQTIDNLDGRYHRVSLSVPLLSPNPSSFKGKAGLDLGYQWPESVDRLGDYREASAKVRLSFEPAPQQAVTASYGVSLQKDAEPYNRAFFGHAKRDISQQVLDIGWAMEVEKNMSLEANIQHRRRDSGVKLFEHEATDVTAGIRWQLD